MRRIDHNPKTGKPFFTVVTWNDHRSQCAKCQEVILNQTASFALACAEGSPLLMEHLTKEQIPAQREKEKAVREWAKKTGVFKDA